MKKTTTQFSMTTEQAKQLAGIFFPDVKEYIANNKEKYALWCKENNL